MLSKQQSSVSCTLSTASPHHWMSSAYLRLNGINAKEHAVFQEIGRVKQYFEKIRNVEDAGLKRQIPSLDKAAADRIIKHALVQNPPFSYLVTGGVSASINPQSSEGIVRCNVLGLRRTSCGIPRSLFNHCLCIIWWFSMSFSVVPS